MEREAPQAYDLLVLDAFSSDAIPVHLLTLEAFEVYRRHLRPGGLIALHISNAFLNLQPVVSRAAARLGWEVILIEDFRKRDRDASDGPRAAEDRRAGLYTSSWTVLSEDPLRLRAKSLWGARTALEEPPPDLRLWTDDDTSLFPILED
jgi:hypothetical protein